MFLFFLQIFLNFPELSRIFLNCPEFFWIFLNFSEFFWIFLNQKCLRNSKWISVPEWFRIILNFSEFFWIQKTRWERRWICVKSVSLNDSEWFWIILNQTEFFWIILLWEIIKSVDTFDYFWKTESFSFSGFGGGAWATVDTK